MKLFLLLLLSLLSLGHAAVPTIRVCQGPVCAKYGAGALFRSCKAVRGLEVQSSSNCLKICAQDKVCVSGKGMGKKTFKASSGGDAKASAALIAKKMGL